MPASRIVTGRGRPEEQVLLLWSALLGGIGLLRATPPPGSLENLLPAWQIALWYWLMLAGGALGLVGCWWPRRRLVRGLLLEQAAQSLMFTACLMYTVTLFAAAGLRATAAGGFLGAWAVVSLIRGLQIHRDIAILKNLSDGELNLHKEPPP